MMENYWLMITAGQGPDECALAVEGVMNCLMKEAKQLDLKVEVLGTVPGNKSGTCISALLCLHGDDLKDFIVSWQGTIQWICDSPYRPHHKRKNWFVAVEELKPFEEHTLFDKKDLKFDTMRASGPGGQHVNTTDSAVRITHLPTGLTAIAREARSQHMNKQLAMDRLALLFEQKSDLNKSDKLKEKWKKHVALKRGNPVRIFVGALFKEKRKI